MKRWAPVLLVLLIVVVVGGALVLGLSGNHSAASACKSSGTPAARKVTIKNSQVLGSHITGKLCDTLTITNEDSTSREIAFGLHDHHEPYDGIAERVLGKGESLTVTLNQAGSFRWHDHIHDEVQGFFTVAR